MFVRRGQKASLKGVLSGTAVELGRFRAMAHRPVARLWMLNVLDALLVLSPSSHLFAQDVNWQHVVGRGGLCVDAELP